MTLDEFINKYEGKPVDWDGKYGAQCVDLYRFYVKEVLGYPQSPPVEGAKDIWNTYLPEYYTRIENTPSGVPEKGDIVIFGETLGRFGHVSIFLEGNASRFTSLDQNYPTGSPVHKQGHSYNAVIGWLRPIDKKMDTPNWFNTLLQEAGLSLDREGQFREFWGKAIKYDGEIKGLQDQIINLNDTLSQRASEVSALTEANQKLRNKADEAEEKANQTGIELGEAKADLRQTLFEKDALEAKVEKLEAEIEKKNSEISKLKEGIDISAWRLILMGVKRFFGR